MVLLEQLHLATPWFTYSCLLILGLLIGSFLNVVVYRLPIMMQREWYRECRLLFEAESLDTKPDDNPVTAPDTQQSTADTIDDQPPFNLAVPRSRCPGCNTPIKAWQNIPVISYLLLRGRCQNCQTHISLRYPLVEVATAIISIVVIWQLGVGLAGLSALLFSWALIALTLIDADTQLLPDSITLPLLWLGLIVNSFTIFTDLSSAVWGAVFGYLALWSVYWLFKLATGKEGMGFGDFKLLAALGAWLGWQQLPLIILLSSLVGAIIGSVILLRKHQGQSTALPFGPYLAIAGWIAMFWGEAITAQYLQFSGIG